MSGNGSGDLAAQFSYVHDKFGQLGYKRCFAELQGMGVDLARHDNLVALARFEGIPEDKIPERIADWREKGWVPAANRNGNGVEDSQLSADDDSAPSEAQCDDEPPPASLGNGSATHAPLPGADAADSKGLDKSTSIREEALPSTNKLIDEPQQSEAVQFLQWLRAGGPWLLTAIKPDGGTITITAMTAQAVDEFVRRYNGKRNIYYSVNPTRKPMDKKAAKTDIDRIEYALADLDPKDDETPDAAKARYLEQLNGAFEPKPSGLIDSGNGIQCLWRLQDQIKLG